MSALTSQKSSSKKRKDYRATRKGEMAAPRRKKDPKEVEMKYFIAGRQTPNDPSPEVTAQWPLGYIPVEIFSLIITFLPRSTIQIMRLVSREFEQKISGELFKTVVVPFRPEIYGIAEASIPGSGTTCTNEPGLLRSDAAVMLQDKGMRVFQGYGGHIKRFAMSFELNYNTLTAPPIKSDQEAITTFWGIYRWPFKKYNRFSQLEGLEQTADETMTMAKALRFIENATELGLSIDGGLGWLCGPDTNPKVQSGKGGARVFGTSRFPEDNRENIKNAMGFEIPQSGLVTRNLPSSVVSSGSDSNGEARRLQMLREAGYDGEDLSQSVQTLLESERPSYMHFLDAAPTPGIPEAIYEQLENEDLPEEQLQRMRVLLRAASSSRTRTNHSFIVEIAKAETSKSYHLKPNELTIAQKEMLLETEWAQRAFMQSYTIAVIDNPPTFVNVRTLTIARLPARHIAILRRADFWDSLSTLEKVSLAIIPDWREVKKLPTSWVDDVRVPPSHSICEVYSLLSEHIATRKSIKVLKFEWLCGGEEAPGIFSRNQHILAAPLVPKAIDMVASISRGPQLLNLPYVEDLTLKNCWISPQVLLQFTQMLNSQSLQSLTLESVSLSAPGTRNVQQLPANQQVNPHAVQLVPVLPHFQNVHLGNGLPFAVIANHAGVQVAAPTLQQQVPLLGGTVAPIANQNGWLSAPRHGSWAHFIDAVTPSRNLAQMRYDRGIDKVLSARPPSKLAKLCFDSCGYARLQLDLDQSMLDPPEAPPGDTSAVAKRRSEIEGFMMVPQELTLGTIINYIEETEQETLETAWSLRFGWGKAGKKMVSEAIEDGIRLAGQGRFRGTITRDNPSNGTRRT